MVAEISELVRLDFVFFGFVVVIHAAVFQRRSIVLSRSFQLILQRPFLGDYGKNLGVSVGELILRHSEIPIKQSERLRWFK